MPPSDLKKEETVISVTPLLKLLFSLQRKVPLVYYYKINQVVIEL